MRSTASILHLDMDAFFASVEQRDKPSLVGKAVIVGGVGGRGVVATASYEARVFGVHSAMAGAQARRLAPHAAFLSGRFQAYRESSKVVMATLRELSPLVEPLSLDEAFVDLESGGIDVEDLDALHQVAVDLRARVFERTEGLSCSVGIGSSKFMAKVASEMAKPKRGHSDQIALVAPGTEVDTIAPLPVRAIPGVGPVTAERLDKLGLRTIADVRAARESELVHELGHASGTSLVALSRAWDDRPVVASRIAKSISVEDTFEHDLTNREECRHIVERHAVLVCGRLKKSGHFARTVTLKAKMADFQVWSRSVTLTGATDSPERITHLAVRMLDSLDLREGVRLLGVGVSNFTTSAQEELFIIDDDGHLLDEPEVTEDVTPVQPGPFGRRRSFDGRRWPPGADVVHDEYGRGWVWGSGHGVVTCRFEFRGSPIGRVRSIPEDDAALHPAHPLGLAWQPEDRERPSSEDELSQ
ncbi:DNA polymerase IV [Cutibacterium avidum]|uniref:DNA polymerase IV n=1 Tax=Cutibacterium avidum TaxID=33010 RepID=UPI0008F58B5F|nr:DNA polymerase IV [Cutibacterium avidum]MDK7699240.1 DNA polymerase IV [Cutibacterium avidum]OIJ76692.1 DNA polymerase IV [Cutibacterium avidum]BDY02857.1 DNA polymerase IV [Cutibacterium avidum]